MTSASDDGTLAADAQAQWGGLQIMGKALKTVLMQKKIQKAFVRFVEGFDAGDVKYGGDDDNDDSGVLSYVVIKYAGYAFTSENELNGLALYTVGDGTEINHIRVHNRKTRIEFVGNVNLKYIYLTGVQDDSLITQMDGEEGNRDHNRSKYPRSCYSIKQ